MSNLWRSFDSCASSGENDEIFRTNDIEFTIDRIPSNNDDTTTTPTPTPITPRRATSIEENIWEFVEDVAYKLFDVREPTEVLEKTMRPTPALRDPKHLDENYRFTVDVRTALRQIDAAWHRESGATTTIDDLYYKVARLPPSHQVRALYMSALVAVQRHQAFDVVYKPRAYRFLKDAKAATMAARSYITLLAQYQWSELRDKFVKQSFIIVLC